MNNYPTSSEVPRRTLLTAGLAGLGVLLTSGCEFGDDIQRAAQGEPEHPETPQSEATAGSALKPNRFGIYLPDWLETEEGQQPPYERIKNLDLSSVTDIYPAFSVGRKDGSLIGPNNMQPGFMSVIEANPQANVGLALGGWGGGADAGETSHDSVIAAWEAILDNPNNFVANVVDKVARLKAKSVIFDFEFPTEAQAKQYAQLVHAIANKLPDVRLGVAAPASSNLGGFLLKGGGGLLEVVDEFQIMAYDNAGSWSTEADHTAPGKLTIDDVNAWIDRVGDASKVSVGFHTAGYLFGGAQRPGDTISNKAKSREISYLDPALAKAKLADDKQQLASGAQLRDGWVSITSPAMIKRTKAALWKEHPNLGGTFLWDASTATQAHFDALAPSHK